MKRIGRVAQLVASLGDRPGLDDEDRMQRRFLVVTAVAMGFGGVVWGTMALFLDLLWQGAIPYGYTLVTVINMTYLNRTKNFVVARAVQVSISLLLPFALQWALGGFVTSGAMMIWALLALTASQSFGDRRISLVWLGVFLAFMVVSVIVDPHLSVPAVMDNPTLTTIAFAINISTVSITVFGLTSYFLFLRHQSAIELARKNVQIAESRQALVQSEKMAAVGRLSAGMAHEMTNPSSAVLRGASHLQAAVETLRGACFELGRHSLQPAQISALVALEEPAQDRIRRPLELGPLERSDRMQVVEGWLDDHETAGPIDPSILVDMGLGTTELDDLTVLFGDAFPLVLQRVTSWHTVVGLLGEIAQGSERIGALVNALKSYTYLDQGSVNDVDVNDGLENTLVMLQGLLKRGVIVHRNLDPELPHIEGRGGELNQVWTNIIDNAVAAMDGEGVLDVTTRQEEGWLVVEITDSGRGVPPDIHDRIFDPFVTTKPVGEGTGLGLSISHNIVVTKHGGTITLDSRPGHTRFTVRLPISASNRPGPARG